MLQQQVGALQDSANQNDERYTRTKADNAALQARVLMLEEQLRETEIRYEEKLQVNQTVIWFPNRSQRCAHKAQLHTLFFYTAWVNGNFPPPFLVFQIEITKNIRTQRLLI